MSTPTRPQSTDLPVIEGEIISSSTGPSYTAYASSADRSAGAHPYAGPSTQRLFGPTQQVYLGRKSVLLAGLLGLLLGPIGMLYSTFFGALVTGFVTILLAVVTLGHATLFPFPACALWAMWAAFRRNERARAMEHYLAGR